MTEFDRNPTGMDLRDQNDNRLMRDSDQPIQDQNIKQREKTQNDDRNNNQTMKYSAYRDIVASTQWILRTGHVVSCRNLWMYAQRR
jgi:hypothetical protein